MAKLKRKIDLTSTINKIDLLEVALHQIKKSDSSAAKKSQYDKFARDALSYVKDERDVLLIAIKIR